jgi:hypothetical protein
MTTDQRAGRQPLGWFLYTHPPVSAMLLGRFMMALLVPLGASEGHILGFGPFDGLRLYDLAWLVWGVSAVVFYLLILLVLRSIRDHQARINFVLTVFFVAIIAQLASFFL